MARLTDDDSLNKRYEDLCKAIAGYNHAFDRARLDDAFLFAFKSHEGVLRKDGSPYITHPLETAIILADLAMDMDTIIAGLLHDVIEDTQYSFDDIVKRFGRTIAELVDGVSKLTRMPYATKEERQMENLRKMLMAMAKDIRVLIIKIADRLHNMRTIEYHTEAKRREKSLETMQIYAPLAYRLGIGRVKMELEELSFRRLEPEAYHDIEIQLQAMRKEKGDFLGKICDKLSEKLKTEGIKFDISSRLKQTYSIYRKMYAAPTRKVLFEIYDLYAVRVLVDTTEDCYNVLGMVHELFAPMPGRFKDYISTPKPNGYQSLHTTVIGREGMPFEVQIRTLDMHHTAEYGIAAHWKYKQGATVGADTDESLKWVRMLLETQQDADADEFITTFRANLFSDQVFVFTPKGDVISLPVGANPIDFAYAIHSAVGNRMTGAKVNSQIATIDRTLNNGDIVEILSQNSTGPKRDWVRIARTAEARNKIKQWFKRERRDENVREGRAMLDDELRRAAIPAELLAGDDLERFILRKLSFASLDDLCGAIGYGGLSAQRAVNRIRDELVRLNKLQTEKVTAEQALEQLKRPAPLKSNINGLIVEGSAGFDAKCARCCLPVPGDPIIGFVTKVRTVSVHNTSCKNAAHGIIDKDPGRWVTAEWGTGLELFETGLRIFCDDREGLAADLLSVLASLKVQMSAFNAQTLDGLNSLIRITVKIRDLEQLRFVTSKLKQVAGVVEITRCGQ
ncbi:(p)ppGpp synthetase [Clostridia bacterium]|nr:(p)ppGpp synthetase [Clostridia bacterium]